VERHHAAPQFFHLPLGVGVHHEQRTQTGNEQAAGQADWRFDFHDFRAKKINANPDK
jgi:hypothetical protein